MSADHFDPVSQCQCVHCTKRRKRRDREKRRRQRRKASRPPAPPPEQRRKASRPPAPPPETHEQRFKRACDLLMDADASDVELSRALSSIGETKSHRARY